MVELANHCMGHTLEVKLVERIKIREREGKGEEERTPRDYLDR